MGDNDRANKSKLGYSDREMKRNLSYFNRFIQTVVQLQFFVSDSDRFFSYSHQKLSDIPAILTEL
jgi:hypothetical protein